MHRPPPDVEFLILGLGNPGREYARSRHNVGFLVADTLARRHSLRFGHRWASAHVACGPIAGRWVALAKPQTYMNLCGDAATSLLQRLRLGTDRLLVIADDIDLPLGRIRLRERGTSGGHRGVQSVIDRLGTSEFARLKIGVGRPDPRQAAEYVLGAFSPDEAAAVADAVDRAADAVEAVLCDGVAVAMNRHNRRADDAEAPSAGPRSPLGRSDLS